MKKYFILLILIISMVSCTDFLNEEVRGKMLSEGFFKNGKDLEMGVNALYNNLNGIYNWTQEAMTQMGGDDVTTRPGSNKQPFRDFDTFSATGESVSKWTTYYQAYRTILAANFILVNYESAVNATASERTLAAGQAYFVRAVCYYHLVRIWNSVPLVTKLEVDWSIDKAKPQDIYALIVDDLKKAEVMLPDSWTGIKKGVAATSGSAKAQLASVYLQMAGYPVKDESKYALAAQKAKEVMDNAAKYGYRLLPNFADLWLANRFNDEIVFGLFYYRNLPFWSDFMGNMWAPDGCKPEQEGGWDDYFAEINFFKKFPAGPRKDATFQTKIRPNATTTLDWTQGAQKHPYYNKMQRMDGDNPDKPWEYVDWWSDRTNMVIRYAEVLLIYAEAKAMSDGPDASALAALNEVRRRAGLPDAPSGMAKLQFRDAVVMERAWEFAGCEIDAARWYDLVRLERVEEAAKDRDPSELPILNPPTHEDYFAPIPTGESLINPKIK